MSTVPAVEAAMPVVVLPSHRRLVLRRFARDRLAVGALVFLVLLLLSLTAGEALLTRALGHGPNNTFP